MNHPLVSAGRGQDHGAADPTKGGARPGMGWWGSSTRTDSWRVQPDLTACLLVKHKRVVAGQAQEPDCLASVPDPTAHQLFILIPGCLIVK